MAKPAMRTEENPEAHLELQNDPATVVRAEEQTDHVRIRVSTQVVLAVAVVGFGCANNISKQIAAKTLERYTYMLSVMTAVIYVPIYFAVLMILLWQGYVPSYQVRFMWQWGSVGRYPFVIFFVVASLGDTLGDVIGMICTPYVGGPVHSLLNNFTPVFMAFLSILILSKRFSLVQCLALLGVFGAVVLGVLPSLESNATKNATKPFFALTLAASCIFNALSFVVKELAFGRYVTWLGECGIPNDGRGLNIFVANSHLAIFQLPFTFLVAPLNQALGQTHGQDIFAYFGDALSCVFGSTDHCSDRATHPEDAGFWTTIYVIFNILWNISVLLSVKYCGAMATFVALKAIFPLSTILFAYINWPLLGQTPVSWLVWASMCLMIPSIVMYNIATRKQDQRAKMDPSMATCCWPLTGRRISPQCDDSLRQQLALNNISSG